MPQRVGHLDLPVLSDVQCRMYASPAQLVLTALYAQPPQQSSSGSGVAERDQDTAIGAHQVLFLLPVMGKLCSWSSLLSISTCVDPREW